MKRRNRLAEEFLLPCRYSTGRVQALRQVRVVSTREYVRGDIPNFSQVQISLVPVIIVSTMPPKPRANRKTSTSKEPVAVALKEEIDTKAMPPPPEPRGPLKIMEAEMNALIGCFKVVQVLSSFGIYLISISRRMLSSKPGRCMAFILIHINCECLNKGTDHIDLYALPEESKTTPQIHLDL